MNAKPVNGNVIGKGFVLKSFGSALNYFTRRAATPKGIRRRQRKQREKR